MMKNANRAEQNLKRILPILAVTLIAGCSAHQTTPAASSLSATPSTSPSTATVSSPSTPPTVTVTPSPVTVTATAAPSPSPASPQALGPCSDGDLSVINGTMQSADTQRHVSLSFINVSSKACTLVGYPGADLVTPAGGLLIHIPRRPALAAHLVTLGPNDVVHADVESSSIDTSTGNDCARWGTLVITPPNDFTSHQLNVDIPICDASISSVD